MNSAHLDRFLDKIHMEPNSGCWLWNGATNNNGYGVFRAYGKAKLSHRISYEHYVGVIPDGLELDHKCRLRCCVNPVHLEPVTHQENMSRGDFSNVGGVAQRNKTHCPQGHEYTKENTRISQGKRHCKACEKMWKYRRSI